MKLVKNLIKNSGHKHWFFWFAKNWGNSYFTKYCVMVASIFYHLTQAVLCYRIDFVKMQSFKISSKDLLKFRNKYFQEKNKLKKIISFFIYYLTKFDDVMWNGFWVIQKTISPNLCKAIHDIINYSTSICLFQSRKCGKEGKKNILRTKRAS